MTHDSMIEVIAAHRDGKQIEVRRLLDNSRWKATTFPMWVFTDFEYRIKPEPPKPREWWIRLYEHGGVIFPDKGSAECEGVTVVHVIEVLPES